MKEEGGSLLQTLGTSPPTLGPAPSESRALNQPRGETLVSTSCLESGIGARRGPLTRECLTEPCSGASSRLRGFLPGLLCEILLGLFAVL